MTTKPKTPQTSVKDDTTEQAGFLLAATGVLEIYSDGKPDAWKRVKETYPQLVGKGRAAPGMPYARFNAENVLTWAVGIVAGDQVKQSMAAQVFHALSAIAFDDKSTPTIRLNALRLLGLECGMFAKKAKAGGKLPFRRIRRVIVDPKETSAKSVGPERKDA